jgi:hypothetical protein
MAKAVASGSTAGSIVRVAARSGKRYIAISVPKGLIFNAIPKRLLGESYTRHFLHLAKSLDKEMAGGIDENIGHVRVKDQVLAPKPDEEWYPKHSIYERIYRGRGSPNALDWWIRIYVS